jgi:hypothetical protein
MSRAIVFHFSSRHASAQAIQIDDRLPPKIIVVHCVDGVRQSFGQRRRKPRRSVKLQWRYPTAAPQKPPGLRWFAARCPEVRPNVLFPFGMVLVRAISAIASSSSAGWICRLCKSSAKTWIDSKVRLFRWPRLRRQEPALCSCAPSHSKRRVNIGSRRQCTFVARYSLDRRQSS